MKRLLLHATATAALLLLVASTAAAQLHQDQMVSGGGDTSSMGEQITWAALGEPLGGRMSGGGIILTIGTPPPASSGNIAPQITSFTPEDKSRFYEGSCTALSAEATDANDDPLTYRFLADGQILQDWSDYPETCWDTTQAAFGWHTLAVEVTDGTETVSQESRAFIFHQPPSP